jgi:hypothetical protein
MQAIIPLQFFAHGLAQIKEAGNWSVMAPVVINSLYRSIFNMLGRIKVRFPEA